jgi:hypothetical protein
MTTSIIIDTHWSGPQLSPVARRAANRTDRLRAIFGSPADVAAHVDATTLARYYAHLTAHLALPFVAYYPRPRNAEEEIAYRCRVVRLLDPSRHLGDELDGIFCTIRKGKYDIHLPLVELLLPEGSDNLELIADYVCWFGTWR